MKTARYIVSWDNNLGKGECLCQTSVEACKKARSMLGTFRRLTAEELKALSEKQEAGI